MADTTTVQVTLRIRPLVPGEVNKGCKEVLEVFPQHQQVRITSDKSFTFNHVFGTETNQQEFYDYSVKPLIGNLFKGYNVTILAYGQTGSGKTHSMGTAYDGIGEKGVIPRAVDDIFKFIKENFAYDFDVTVSFMELYQEVLYDLLSNKSREQSNVDIREDNKGIFIPGLTETPVVDAAGTLELLKSGSQGRATACTNMNSQSSRSHAIFTINISMRKRGTSDDCKQAKFHLVDLAGSERSKKTGATGQTFKEGVNINKGLLALGNVISALGDEKSQAGYISYRDSNLTRLLKDSLGGNSITLMIACVSPADYNMEETLSTLRYADRARKIKNKPIINEDPKTGEINRLNKLIKQLQLELIGQGGPAICPAEIELLKKELAETRIKNGKLSITLSSALNENTALLERVLIMQNANEGLSQKLNVLKDEYNLTLNHLNTSLEQSDVNAIKEHMTTLITIQTQFTELDMQYKKNEEVIRIHEIDVAKHNSNNNIASASEINERQELYTAQQIEMNDQLQEVTKRLAQKELLAEQIAFNAKFMVDSKEMAENEAKIISLQKEKEDLVQQLKNVTVQGDSKLSKQRKKRVDELEKQIQELNRKVVEQSKLIKLKEKDQKKIDQLNNEINNMKATKVKLIKNMRQESEKFRTWKLERERELSKLKNQDRKRQNQIVKMETIHNRQQNVLKRKVEQAAAINKRLKEALAVRKTAQDSKLNGKIERLGPWIRRELDVFISTVDAQASLQMLIEDRGELQQQLDNLKEGGEINQPEIVEIENDIELRSTQIQELQQKILDSDEEEKSKTRFDNIQSMAEAKYLLKYVFGMTAQMKKTEVTKEYKINELQETISDLTAELNQLNAQIKTTEKKHIEELDYFDRENEDKISVLLRQLRGIEMQSADEELQRRCNIQLQTIEKLEYTISTLSSENSDLKNKVLEMSKSANSTAEDGASGVSKVSRKTKSSSNKENKTKKEFELPGTPLNLDISYEQAEDYVKDPDWQKTPLAKRVNAMRRTFNHNDDGPSEKLQRNGCGCRGRCGTKVCGCRKFGNSCGISCKCSTTTCVNRNTELVSSELSETRFFKAPRAITESDETDYEPTLKRSKLFAD